MFCLRPACLTAVVLLAVAGAGGCGSEDDRPPVGAASVPPTNTGHGPGGPTAPLACVASDEPFGLDPGFGHNFPDVELMDCGGSMVTLDQVRCESTITLLAVGAGWCEPCAEEAPELQRLRDLLGPSGLGVAQVMIEDPQGFTAGVEFCQSWTDRFTLTYPVFADPLAATSMFFPEGVLPGHVVIDHDGKVLWAALGQIPENFEQVLEELIVEATP